MHLSGPFRSELDFQRAEEGYKREEREGIEGQTTMPTATDYYIRRFVSVWVKFPANMVLMD